MRNVAVRNAMGPTKRRRQPRTFAILPTGPDVPAARFAVLLAGALGRIGNQVQMLGPDSIDQEPEWFARCEMESSFVLYRADPTATQWTELCLRQADCLVVVRNADNDLPTKVLFEIEGMSETIAREAFRLASAKLSVSTAFVKRQVRT